MGVKGVRPTESEGGQILGGVFQTQRGRQPLIDKLPCLLHERLLVRHGPVHVFESLDQIGVGMLHG